MTNKKGTKRALLTSVLSLLLCCSMLIGTTFAWFTDEIKTVNNRITAGNLDIALYYKNDVTGDVWTAVDSTTNIFETNTYWEPGHTEVIKLKVVNEGTLALKYQLGINIVAETGSVNVNDKAFKLSDYIYYGIVEGEQNYNRKQAVAAVEDSAKLIKNGYTKSSKMENQNDEVYLTLVVYMPETVGNEANYKKGEAVPTIDLGLNLFATQYTYEEDSYGDDYDAGAPWTGLLDYSWYDPSASEYVITTGEQLAGFAALVNGTAVPSAITYAAKDPEPVKDTFKGKTVKLGENINLNGMAWTPIKGFAGTFDGDGHIISNLYVNGTSQVAFFSEIASTATIKNVAFDKANIVGEHWVAVVLAYETNGIANATIENVTVMNATITCDTDANNDNGDKAGGIVGYATTVNVIGCTVKNTTITAYRDFAGIMGYANSGVVLKDNTVTGLTLVIDKEVNYKNYTTDAEHDAHQIVGEAAAGAVISGNGIKVADAAQLGAALQEDCEIVLTDDIVIPADNSLVIPADTKVTLNLNGSSIEGANVKSLGALIVNNGELEIVGGTMNNTVANGAAVIDNAGTLTLKGVNVVGAPMADGSYPEYAICSTGKLTVEEGTTVTSDRGALRVFGETVINGGKFVATDKANGRTITMHTVYAYGGTLTINGGEFENNYTGVSGASVICPAGATINIYGGTFTDAVTDTSNFNNTANIQNYMGYGKPVNIYGGTFNDTTVNKNVASGYKAVTNDNGTYTVVFPQESFDSLIENAQPGETVKVPAGNYTFPASKLEEGMILECAPGTVFEGSSSLAIKGATIVGATFANPADKAAGGTVNGVFKDCTFTGYNALRYCYAGETVVFENCVFSGDLYGIHFDGGANDVTFKNCTFSGFNTMGSAITKLTMENCTFVANGRSNYNGINLWGNTDMVNCTFIFDGTAGTEWIDLCGDNKTASFTNCVVTDGVNTTDIATVVGDYGEGNTIIIDGVAQVEASSQDALNSAISSGNVNITLSEGDYKMPSSTTTGEVVISGTKDTVLDVTQGAYLDSADGVTIEGVTIKTSTGKANGNGSDYAALYAKDVTYVNCTFVGPMRVGRDGAKFINCTFTELGNDYVWTYGNDVTFEECTFNTDGKAILIYSDGGKEVSQVSVKDCVFNATKGAKAGAINNQNCAAIEIHNYGNGVNLVTEGNTYDANFSGEWRIKTYETGRTQVFVNGTEYTTIAIDGKTMTIDSNKNVTVND